MRKLYYDTCVYNAEGLDLLFRIVGTDRCMFGTENPGTGSAPDRDTGRQFDDLKPVIDDADPVADRRGPPDDLRDDGARGLPARRAGAAGDRGLRDGGERLMAKVVAGIAAAHSPQLNIEPKDWNLIVKRDEIHPHLDMAALRAVARPDIAEELTMEAWQRRYDACQVAIERIGEIHREVERGRRRDHRQRPGRDVQVRQHAVPRRLLGRRGLGRAAPARDAARVADPGRVGLPRHRARGLSRRRQARAAPDQEPDPRRRRHVAAELAARGPLDRPLVDVLPPPRLQGRRRDPDGAGHGQLVLRAEQPDAGAVVRDRQGPAPRRRLATTPTRASSSTSRAASRTSSSTRSSTGRC